MKQKRNGFTLIECLITMAVVSILVMIAVPLTLRQINKYQESSFFQLVEHDLLIAQSLAMVTEDKIYMTIDPYYYKIHSKENTYVQRSLPKGYVIHTKSMNNPISFNINGSIRKPGTMVLTTKHQQVHLIFPLGKGRARFEKQ